jgi:hypothetical protein
MRRPANPQDEPTPNAVFPLRSWTRDVERAANPDGRRIRTGTELRHLELDVPAVPEQTPEGPDLDESRVDRKKSAHLARIGDCDEIHPDAGLRPSAIGNEA